MPRGLTTMPGMKPTDSVLATAQPLEPLSPLPSTHLLEQEFVAPYTAWRKEPTPHNKTVLLQQMSPIIDKALTTYTGNTNNPLLRSRAKILALQGLDRYDPSRAKLQSYMLQHLQALRRYAAKADEIISIPERVRLDLLDIDHGEKELTDKLGREPTLDELSDHLMISPKRILYVRQAAQPIRPEGFYLNRGEADENENLSPEVVNTNFEPWLNFVYQDLNPRDKLIMDYALGRNGKKKLGTSEIAQKLQISPATISQRLAWIQQQIDQHDELQIGF